MDLTRPLIGEQFVKSGTWSAGSRVAGALAGVSVLILAGRGLERVEVGCLLILIGLGAVVSLVDLGIPNALLTPVASAHGRGDHDRVNSLVAAARAATSATAALLLVVATVIASVVDVRLLLGVGTSITRSTVTAAWLAAAVCSTMTLATSSSPKVLVATGRAAVVGRIGVAGAIAQVVAGILAASTGARMAWFVAAASTSQLFTGVISSVVLRPWRRSTRRPHLAVALRSLMRRGGVFFGIAVSGIVAFEADGLVISHALGASAAAEYLVPARLILFVPSVVQVFLTPLWPGVAEAVAVGRASDLLPAWRRSLALSAAAAVLLGGIAAVALRPLTEVVAPDVRPPSIGLVASLFALSVVLAMSAPVAAVLSGLDLTGRQLASASAMAAANITASIWLVNEIGTPGPAIATVVCQTAISLVPLGIMIERRLTQMEARGG